MNLTEAILKRRSVRKYKSGCEIPDTDLKQILNAAMHAPNAKNTRAWEFIVIKSDEAKERALKIHPYAQHLKDASLAVLVCAHPELQQGIAEGFYPQDCGAAVQNIMLQSLELGYGSCWCGIYPKEERVELFKKEFDLKCLPIALVVIGVADCEPSEKGYYDESLVTII